MKWLSELLKRLFIDDRADLLRLQRAVNEVNNTLKPENRAEYLATLNMTIQCYETGAGNRVAATELLRWLFESGLNDEGLRNQWITQEEKSLYVAQFAKALEKQRSGLIPRQLQN